MALFTIEVDDIWSLEANGHFTIDNKVVKIEKVLIDQNLTFNEVQRFDFSTDGLKEQDQDFNVPSWSTHSWLIFFQQLEDARQSARTLLTGGGDNIRQIQVTLKIIFFPVIIMFDDLMILFFLHPWPWLSLEAIESVYVQGVWDMFPLKIGSRTRCDHD